MKMALYTLVPQVSGILVSFSLCRQIDKRQFSKKVQNPKLCYLIASVLTWTEAFILSCRFPDDESKWKSPKSFLRRFDLFFFILIFWREADENIKIKNGMRRTEGKN